MCSESAISSAIASLAYFRFKSLNIKKQSNLSEQMNIQMDDADDDPRDLNELTNESTKSMIISNSQGVERDFLPNIKTIKKQFLPFSQEEVRSTELCCAIDSSQINQDFNDIYSEFPEVIMYRSYIYKK